ncbi:MAG: DUF2378 family protein [Archangium sp.]|nr:DUF2378 family protein [Archangium sp.]
MGEALVWRHTIEGLIRVGVARGDGTPWKSRMKEVGLNVDAPLATAYPRDQWKQFIATSAEVLFQGTEEERLEQVGKAFIEEYAETFLGRAVASVLKLIGPRRALERMTKSLRSGNSYSDTRATFTGATSAEFWLNDTLGFPTYIVGALGAVMRITSAKNVVVKPIKIEGVACTFIVTWDP